METWILICGQVTDFKKKKKNILNNMPTKAT